jgi:hypothetical protein
MSARDVRLVQTCYPQIYLACHTQHTRAASVLEPARVRRMLARLTPAERRVALDGLSILAGAAQALMKEKRDA